MHISSKIWVQLFVCLAILALSYGQYNRIHNEDKVEILDPNLSEGETRISWCTVSKLEQYKCQNLSMAIQQDRSQFGADYMELHCKQAFDSEECMTWVDDGKASILSLDAGEVYIAGRYHSLVPILQQIYEGGFPYQYAVAVVKKGDLPNIVAGEGLHAMRGAKACFPLVGSMAGWVLPIHTLMQQGGLKVIDCNNHIKSAIEYFGESCAINSLVNMYNPIGDNSDKLCTLCDGGAGIRCTPVDPYAGYNGALRCLLERGDVAFLRHTTISRAIASRELLPGVTEDRFELICPDGSRGPTSEWLNCNWGRAPADAIVASSAKDQEHRAKFQRYLQKMVQIYGQQNRLNQTQFGRQDDFNHQRDPYGYGQLTTERPRDPNNPYAQRDNEFGSRWDDQFINNARRTQSTSTTTESSLHPIERFHLFDSIRHGTTDLLVQDSTVSLKTLGEGEQAAAFVIENGPVGIKASEALKGIRDCPIKRATLCLTSDAEKDKCIKMRVALKAAFLSPDLVCLKAHSARVCERFIEEGQADFAVFDAADMLHAAAKHRLVPFMTEIYSDGTSSYYAVAVAKEQDPDTDITYLRGKNTCHTGISMAAGWIYPLAYLISNGWIRSYGCDGARAASEYFTKSCAPGALSSEYADTSHGVPRDNLCQLCHGGSWRRCRREHDEPYYGHTGALRCLVEGGGDVAFVRHTAPAEVSGGRRTEWWSRNLLYDDLQLLCPDGTRAKMFEYERCNLGRVPGSVLMGRPNHTELDAFANLMVYAEQLYGATTSDDFSFSMFFSPSPYADLIFSDAAVRLRPLPHAERSADLVAGPTLPRAARLVSCDAASADAYIAADPDFLSGAWKGKDRNWGVLTVGVGVSVWLIVFG